MVEHDLAIIGTGTAARGIAGRVRRAGWNVAVIDHRPFGGTCLLRGCDPKKVLYGAAEAVDFARRRGKSGLEGEPRLDWRMLMDFKRSFTDPAPERQVARYAEQGIATYQGLARFTGHNRLEVDGKTIEAAHIAIAAGAEPIALGIPGAEHAITSEAFLALESLPPSIVFVGGGYIAAEFSHIAARAGAKTTVLQRGERMLKTFDPDVVNWLMESFRRAGIEVRVRTTVRRIEQTNEGYRVHAQVNGETVVVEADLVVHAAGRKPPLGPLELERAGVKTENGRIVLNEFLQSVSNAAVYAAGDAADAGPPLTPVASHDAEVVAANLLQGNHRNPDYRAVPSVAFSLPPIAAVGLREHEARAQGLVFRVNLQDARDWFTARQSGGVVYGFKVLIEESSDCILGAHLVGPHADEVINLFAVAIRNGLTASDLKGTILAYPTSGSDIHYMV